MTRNPRQVDSADSPLNNGESQPRAPHESPKTARHRLMDLLAGRSLSEAEIRRKMAGAYPGDQIEDAIEFARERRWLTDAETLATDTAASLNRKLKGHRFIEETLSERGLPPPERDESAEIGKARAVVAAKLGGKLPKDGAIDYELQKKIYRLLANRGFDEDTIAAVVGPLPELEP